MHIAEKVESEESNDNYDAGATVAEDAVPKC